VLVVFRLHHEHSIDVARCYRVAWTVCVLVMTINVAEPIAVLFWSRLVWVQENMYLMGTRPSREKTLLGGHAKPLPIQKYREVWVE